MRQYSFRIWIVIAIGAVLGAPALGQPTTVGRKLAPGVMKTIPPETEKAETITGPREFSELFLAAPDWTPKLEPETVTLAALTKQTTFRRGIWQLELSFKPVRMLDGSGNEQVWYMVYRVRNLGNHLSQELKNKENPNEGYEVKRVNYPVRFFPVFELVDHETGTHYTDQVVPWAVNQIHRVEIRDPRVKLRNSIEMSRVSIEISSDEIDKGIWGVAVWKDVAPTTDFFSVYVRGLTNAYKWEDAPGGFKAGDPPMTGRTFTYKALQLNFWRPGDKIRETNDRIRYGMPLVSKTNTKLEHFKNLYKVDEPRSHVWRYLPPAK